MATIRQSIDIKATPEAVFALIIDPEQRGRLNPQSTVLSITHEPEGPVKVGTVFQYRVVVQGKTVEYCSECTGFEPSHYMDNVTDTNPPFRVRLSVEATANGTRLTQEESFDLSEYDAGDYGAELEVGGLLAKLFNKLVAHQTPLGQDKPKLAIEEADMVAILEPRLIEWLEALKAYLEKEHTRLYA